MPPQIAFIICIIFIVFLFVGDFRREPEVSRALWIPLFWILIIGSRPLSLWLDVGVKMESPEAYLEGSPFDRNIYSLLIVAGLVALTIRKIQWGQIVTKNIWIIIFFLYCGVSISWSDYPFVSFKRWIKGIGDWVMVLIVLTDRDHLVALRTLIRRFSYIMIPLSLVLVKYFPDWGRYYDRWIGHAFYRGVGWDKNALGYLCLICGFFFIWDLLTMWHNRKIYLDKTNLLINVIMIVIVCWLMVKAQSSTSLGGLIAGSLFLALLGLSIIKSSERRVDFFALFGSFLSFILFVLFDLMEIALSALNRDATMTGRTEIWKILLNMETNPLIGVGYESFWLRDRAQEIAIKFGAYINEAHNGYLEIYLNIGAVGLLLVIGIIIAAYRNSRKALLYEFDYGRFRMGFLGVVLLYGITEAAFRELSPIWFIFLLIATERPQDPEEVEIASENETSEKKYFENTGK